MEEKCYVDKIKKTTDRKGGKNKEIKINGKTEKKVEK